MLVLGGCAMLKGVCEEPGFRNWKNNEACVQWVNETYSALGLEQRVAQFFMVAAYTDTPNFNMLELEALAKQGKIGGLIFFKGHPTAQAYWTNRIQAVSKLPLMIGIDGEWGLAMRVDSTPVFPHQLTLGAISDSYLIREMGREIARECNRIGVNVNFAPDVDINNNPQNPVINDRSFGENKMLVALKGIEYMNGLQEGGVLACAKHFPGHGDTDKDSHLTLPTITKPLLKLEDFELYPFRALIGNGVGSVMVAHLNVPALDPTGKLPASLSAKIIQQKLQNEMGFDGLVFSDALNMKAVSENYPPGVLDSIAFAAGNDILVFSKNSQSGLQRIAGAWANGKLEESYMEERVKKVLAYKYLLGLNAYTPVETEGLYDSLNTDSAKALRALLFERAITVAANGDSVLPIKKPAEKKIATLSIDSKTISEFQNHVQRFANTDRFNARDESSAILNPLLDTLAAYSRVIVDVHGMSRMNNRNYGLADASIQFINDLSKRTQVILVLFGSPYSLKYFDSLRTVVVAYEENEVTQLAAANVIFGGLGASGKLPVSASSRFAAGTGSVYEAIRLKIGMPEEEGMSADVLREMDEIALNGIIGHAFPGCQILVAKNGNVVWNKSYGNKIYENSTDKVQPTDLYDLASVTKIAATTLAVMKLYDEKQIDLNKTVGDYLTLDDSATITRLKLGDILTHQAGLKAFYEFFRRTIDSNSVKYYRTQPDDTFKIKVADDMYLRSDFRDSMWYIMAHSPVKPDPGYLYSDLDFYILQKVVEYVSQKPLDEYVSSTFYEPMGLSRIAYKPLEKFMRYEIVPTENDKIFRKQLIQGYVHDPGAAMYGGVAGHAGLFSDAFDLAQLMQLLLNKGVYNGQRFFCEETVALFTKQYSSKSRRGLGFDKPEPDPKKLSPCYEGMPLSSFGHTGFTGTCVWVDPVNQLTFIFLSNRVYPDADNGKLVRMNVRSELQKTIYRAIKK